MPFDSQQDYMRAWVAQEAARQRAIIAAAPYEIRFVPARSAPKISAEIVVHTAVKAAHAIQVRKRYADFSKWRDAKAAKIMARKKELAEREVQRQARGKIEAAHPQLKDKEITAMLRRGTPTLVRRKRSESVEDESVSSVDFARLHARDVHPFCGSGDGRVRYKDGF